MYFVQVIVDHFFYYKFNYLQCIDINECSRNTSGCNQTCANTVGSYYCSCNSGYNLSDNDHDCIGL